MGSALITLAAAIIGGIITLSTVLMTQRASRALQQQEQLRSDLIRTEDQKREWYRELIAQRRVAYTHFNASARTTRDAMKNCMNAYKAGGSLDSQLRQELETEWRAYVIQHAASHMIVSDRVLNLVGSVNGSLRSMYGMTKRLDQGGTPQAGDSVAALEGRLDRLWPRLEAMREAMRCDLGVTDSSPVRAS